MGVSVNDVNTLNKYVDGVMGRVNHHAKSCKGVALALLGAIIWRKDPEPLKVLVNVLWAKIGGQRYAFSYQHATDCIEMRMGSTQGAVLHSFDDHTTAKQVQQIFASL